MSWGSRNMSTLNRARRHRAAPCAASASPPLSHPPTPDEVRRLRVQFSTDLVHALRQVEGLDRLSLDDLEWADAIATAMVARTVRRTAAGQPT